MNALSWRLADSDESRRSDQDGSARRGDAGEAAPRHLRRSEQRVLPGLYRVDLFQKQFEPIEFPADLSLQMIRQRAAIARLQLVEPLASIAAQRLVVGYALAEQQSLEAVDVRLPRTTQSALGPGSGWWWTQSCETGLSGPNSQLTGKITGNNSIFGLFRPKLLIETCAFSVSTKKFP